jgi:hypothetical protein
VSIEAELEIITLAHRIKRGRNILEAHNEHVYQLLVRMGRSHQAAATLYLTAMVLSTTAAIVVTDLTPGAQYTAALAIIAVLIPLAASVYARASDAGLLSGEPGTPIAPAIEERPQVSAAAE